MITETSPDTDEHGLTRLVSQTGTKRRYSYDAGVTWGSTPSKARDAAGIRGRHEIGGICVLMTSTQASRWNCGGSTERDLDTVAVFVGGDDERELTLRRATSDRLEPDIAKCMKDREAVFCNY
jgi:hypothetical protein